MTGAIFYFDFGSPNAYLVHKVLPQIEARTGVRFDYVPILLGGLFKLTGNQPPFAAYAGVKAKLDYMHLEMRRFVEQHGLDAYRFNPHFPVNTLALMRGAVAAQGLGVFERYVDQVFDDLWERERKMDEADVIRASLTEAGLPAEELIQASQSAEVKARLAANTEAAAAAGAFGSPSFLVGSELFFGKERLDQVEAEIARQSKARGAAT